MTDRGVRSSWETSDVNCFSFSKVFSILSNMLLKFFASLWISSLADASDAVPSAVPFTDASGTSPSCMSILLVRSPSLLISSTVLIIFLTGLKALLVMIYPPRAAMTTRAGHAIITSLSINENELCSAKSFTMPRTHTA